MKLRLDELISNEDWEACPIEHKFNIIDLYSFLLKFRHACNLPFVIRTAEHPNRGYRSMESHIKLYEKIGRTPPMGSSHLIGAACDIADPDQKIKTWVLDHLDWVESHDVYFEAFDYTSGWVHVQRISPRSGNRFFKPYN